MTAAQERALEDHWDIYGLGVDEGEQNFDQVFELVRPIILEIGFGMGESLYKQALKDPDTNFIGVDVHRPGIGNLIQLLERTKTKNLKIYGEDAIEIMKTAIKNSVLSGVQLLFPDPWPKKKHHKRRLVTKDFIELLSQKLRKGGTFLVVTDSFPYYEVILDLFSLRSDFTKISSLTREETKYERRAKALGNEIHELFFRLDQKH